MADHRKVTAPDGTEWEVYVSTLVPPDWRPGDELYMRPGRVGFLGEGPFSALVEGLFVPLVKFGFALPFAVSRGNKSGVFWVEAKSYYPEQQHYYWSATSRELADQAVDEVASDLAAGQDVPRPSTAAYRGTSQTD